MCWYNRRSISFQRLVLHLINLIILVTQMVIEADATLFLGINRSLELGGFLLETVPREAVFEELSDKMLVDDMTLKLCRRDHITVPKFEVLEKEAGAVERLVATNADQLLVYSVILLLISKVVLMIRLYTYHLDVSLQPRFGLELFATNTTSLVMLSRPHDLVPRFRLDVHEVFVALVAVIVFV